MTKLNSYNIDKTILTLFYQTCITSILNFCLISWTGNARQKDIQRIDRCLKAACKIISEKPYHTFANLEIIQCKKKINKIINDKTHPLFKQIQFS